MYFETLDCRDPKFSDEKHLDNLEIFTENLIQTINKSANDNLNTVGGKKKTTKKKVYPGWKETVSPYKEKAEFWNFLWEEAGKLRFGETFNIMKHTKAQLQLEGVRKLLLSLMMIN